MSEPMRNVDARLPLALLQAVQRQDTPEEWLPDENPGSVFPQRLGLSGVVDGQVRRFHRLARWRRRVEETQVEALLELISRRRDAAEVFAAAGHGLAGYHFSGMPGFFRRIARRLPPRLRERAMVRALRTASGAFLVASEQAVEGAPLQVQATGALTARVRGAGAACQLYAALATKLLELSGAGDTRIIHSECQGRGDRHCVWTAQTDGGEERTQSSEAATQAQCSSLGST